MNLFYSEKKHLSRLGEGSVDLSYVKLNNSNNKTVINFLFRKKNHHISMNQFKLEATDFEMLQCVLWAVVVGRPTLFLIPSMHFILEICTLFSKPECPDCTLLSKSNSHPVITPLFFCLFLVFDIL